MPSSVPVQRFSDIIENIEAIERFTAGMDLRGFALAEQTIRASKYSLLVTSEPQRNPAPLPTISTLLSSGGKLAAWEPAEARLPEHRCCPHLAIDRARFAAAESRLP